MPRKDSITHSVELALESAKQAKRAAAAIEKAWLSKLAPYLGNGKAKPEIRRFVQLIGRHLDALGTDLATSLHQRELQLKVKESQKDREQKAAQQVRTMLVLVRFYLSNTLGRASFHQYCGGTSRISRLAGVALLDAGENLARLLRDETMGWDSYAENICCISRTRIATGLELALVVFRQELAANEPRQGKRPLVAEAWRKERAETLEGIAAARQLLRALMSDAGSELEGRGLPPKARQRKSAGGKGPAEKERASRARPGSGTGATM